MKRKRENDGLEESSDENADKLNQNYRNINNQNKNNNQNLLICEICSKQYKNAKTLKQHIQSHMSKRKCELCDKSYIYLKDLRIHQYKIHGLRPDKKQKLTSFTCGLCNKTFERRHHLKRHVSTVHHYTIPEQQSSRFSCRHCESEFQNYVYLFQHVTQNHPLNQNGGQRPRTQPTLSVDIPSNDQDATQLDGTSNNSGEQHARVESSHKRQMNLP